MIKAIVRLIIPLALFSLACAMLQQVTDISNGSNLTPPPSTDATQTLLGSNPEPAIDITQTPAGLGPQTASPTPTLTATPAFVCPNAPPTRFKVGDKGQVTYSKGPGTRLRRDPEVVDNKFIKLLPDGTQFEIMAGPVCAVGKEPNQAFIFWQISIPDDPLTGWIAEGDAVSYFIEPIP